MSALKIFDVSSISRRDNEAISADLSMARLLIQTNDTWPVMPLALSRSEKLFGCDFADAPSIKNRKSQSSVNEKYQRSFRRRRNGGSVGSKKISLNSWH